MTHSKLPVKFVIGSRMLFSVPRALQTVAFDLDDLLRAENILFPAPDDDADGFRVMSIPRASLVPILTRYPGYHLGGLKSFRRFYIEMAGKSFDDYLARFSSKTRSTLKRKHRKLLEHAGHRLDVREFRHEKDVDAFISDAVPLSRRTYQSRLLNDGLPEGPRAVSAMKDLARQNQMRAYVLYAAGRPVSYLYLPTTGEIITYAHLGYDPDYAQLSVGTVLQMIALERLFAEKRYRYFDFTEGEGAHKEMFGTHNVAACSFFLLKPAISNALLIGALNAFDSSVAVARGLAERNGALAYFRRILRG